MRWPHIFSVSTEGPYMSDGVHAPSSLLYHLVIALNHCVSVLSYFMIIRDMVIVWYYKFGYDTTYGVMAMSISLGLVSTTVKHPCGHPLAPSSLLYHLVIAFNHCVRVLS